MATKFMTLKSLLNEDKENTKFTHVILKSSIETTTMTPNSWNNVLWIGYDEIYGDVFKCWDNNSNNFNLFFGIKGDEFND